MTYRWKNHDMEFIERLPGRAWKPAIYLFKVPDFAGLNAPDDPGFVVFADWQLREVERKG